MLCGEEAPPAEGGGHPRETNNIEGFTGTGSFSPLLRSTDDNGSLASTAAATPSTPLASSSSSSHREAMMSVNELFTQNHVVGGKEEN